jgi:hypothetical protein
MWNAAIMIVTVESRIANESQSQVFVVTVRCSIKRPPALGSNGSQSVRL